MKVSPAVLVCLWSLSIAVALTSYSVYGCGACYRLPYQSLIEKVEGWDRVVIARPVSPSGSSWSIDRVIKGDVVPGQERPAVEPANTSAQGGPARPQILRWDENGEQWRIETVASQDVVQFLSGAVALSESKSKTMCQKAYQRTSSE